MSRKRRSSWEGPGAAAWAFAGKGTNAAGRTIAQRVARISGSFRGRLSGLPLLSIHREVDGGVADWRVKMESVRTIELPTGAAVGVLGQGTWNMGEDRQRRSDE